MLRDVADLDYAEIAEVLGVPVGTVKSRIARGRAALAGSHSAGTTATRRTSKRRTRDDERTARSDDDWALASAYVDGEVDEHERALVDGGPGCSANWSIA